MQGDRATAPSAKPKPRKKPVVQPPAGDIASSGGDYGKGEAEAYKKTKAYKGAVRTGYKGNQHPKQALADNIATARKGKASTEQQVVFQTHADSVRGNRKNAASRAGKDTKGNDDRQRALKFLADHPEILKPKKYGKGGHAGGILGTIDNALSGKLTEGAVNVAKSATGVAAPYVVAGLRGPIGFAGDKLISHLSGHDIEKGLTSVAKPIGRDLVDIPANAIPSVYVPAREAASGHPLEAAKMLAEPFVETAKHPIKSLKEHPIGTALIASGAEGAVGHGIGKALRTAPSKTLKQVGSVERRTAEIPNARTNIREDRTYSKDAIVKAVQVLHDKRLVAKGQDPIGAHVTEADVARRTNERVALDEDVRRANRGAVVHEARTILDQRGPMAKVKGHRPTAATTLMAQHIADTPAELHAYLGALEEAAKGLEGDKLRRNKETQGLVRKALKHPGRLARNAEQAANYRDLSNRIQGELAKTGIIDPKQMEQRRLLSYATSPAKGMNARMLKPHETEAAVKRASETMKRAKSDLAAAKSAVVRQERKAGRSQGRAEVRTQQADTAMLRRSKVYVEASRELGKAQTEMRAARKTHSNAHRNPDLWTTEQRHAIEQRAAKAEQDLKAAQVRFRGAKEKATKRLSTSGKNKKLAAAGPTAQAEIYRPPLLSRKPQGALRVAERNEAEALRRKQAVENAKADLAHARKQLAKARKVHQQGGHLVDEHGVKVTRQRILDHMKENGVEGEGAYITHAPGKRGARNFYVDPTKAQGYFGPKATGAAVKEGTLDLHPEAMVEAVAHAQGLVDATHRFRGYIDEMAHRKANGKVWTTTSFLKAQDKAREMMVDKDGAPLPHAIEMRPVRLNPLGGRAEQMRATLESVDSAAAHQHIAEAIDQALSGQDTGPGEWGLAPAKSAETLRAHTNKVGTTTAGKVGQLYGGQFRKVVLSLSPKWLTGNIVEAALRSLIGHAGVRSYYTGRAVQKRHGELYGKEAVAELRSRTTGGGHYSLASRTDVRRTAEDIAQAGDRVAKFSEAMGKLRRAPVAKQVADTWDLYTHVVMQSLNGRLEHQFQTAMMGKALREHPLMSDHTIKLSRAALDDAAKGLSDTTAQVRLGREVDRMYGKYSKFSPGQRRMIAGYTPFIAWSLNTVRFLFDVLPRDHPVLTSVLASANIATEDWRRQHGLVRSFTENLTGMASAGMQGSIPGKDGSYLRISHFSPTGIFDQEGGLLAAFAGALLPQVAGAQENLQGKDWKGDNLKGKFSTDKPTDARNLLAAGMTVLENSVPFLSQAVDVAGIHAPNEADGTKHPPTALGRLRKRNDPFMYSQPAGGGGSTLTMKDILSGKAPLPKLPKLPALPKSITIQVH